MGIPFFFSQFSATKLKENKIKQMMLTSSGNAQPKAQYNSTQITAQPNLVRAIDSNLSRVTRLLSLPDEHHILIIIKNAHLISLPPSLSTYSWFCLFCSFFFYWGGGGGRLQRLRRWAEKALNPYGFSPFFCFLDCLGLVLFGRDSQRFCCSNFGYQLR